MSKRKTIKRRVYISTGSHDKVFMFYTGNIATLYPKLLWVFNEKITPDLIPATLTYKAKAK